MPINQIVSKLFQTGHAHRTSASGVRQARAGEQRLRSGGLLALGLATVLVPSSLTPQEPATIEVVPPSKPGTQIELLSYLPMREGDSWLYREDKQQGDSQETHHVSTFVSEESTAKLAGSGSGRSRDLRRLRIDHSNGAAWREGTAAGVGLLWLEEVALGGRSFVYDGGLHVLPSQVETGASYLTSGTYQLVTDEEITGLGTVQAKVTVGDLADVSIPAGDFEESLKLVFELEYRDSGADNAPGTASKRRLTRWYARGIGVVREESLSPFAAPLSAKPAKKTLVLVEASVGETLVPADEDDRPAITGSKLLEGAPPR